ncbi:hypothetical protein [Planktotalea sp.]|uniref:hypothetical protein n=1 Tax=Planktotalea sp. TaxID=2029877 RepID=UPI00329A7E61
MRLPLLSVLLLSACTSLVPSSAILLNQVSPYEADPAGFAVSLILPEGLEITEGSAQLTFSARNTETDEILETPLILERLKIEGAIFHIAPKDLAALRETQSTAREWKAVDEDAVKGSLAVTIEPCKLGDGPATDAVASVAIRMSEDGAFLPLINNGPISAIIRQDALPEMKPCTPEK